MLAQSVFAEIYALILALQHLIQQGLHLHSVLLESDCLLLVEILRQKQQPPWTELHLFTVLQDLFSQCPNVSIQHVRREANLAADWVAKAHRVHGPVRHWLVFPPPLFQDIVLSDALLAGCTSLLL